MNDGPFETIHGYKQYHNWTKKFIFWDLLYWKGNLLGTTLILCTLRNFFFDNIFNIVMNDKGKTKENQKARIDIVELCACGDLELVQLHIGKLAKSKGQLHEMKNVKVIHKWINKLKIK